MNKQNTLADLNKAIAALEAPIYCKHCHTEIEWDLCNWKWMHKLPSLDNEHAADSWSYTMTRDEWANSIQKLLVGSRP